MRLSIDARPWAERLKLQIANCERNQIRRNRLRHAKAKVAVARRGVREETISILKEREADKQKKELPFLAEYAPPVLDPFCGGGSIPLEAQVALALKTLCGFSIGEISRAFLTTEAAIAKLFWISLLGLVSTSTTWPQSFRAEGAKSFVSSWSDFMSVIASKSATVGKAA